MDEKPNATPGHYSLADFGFFAADSANLVDVADMAQVRFAGGSVDMADMANVANVARVHLGYISLMINTRSYAFKLMRKALSESHYLVLRGNALLHKLDNMV